VAKRLDFWWIFIFFIGETMLIGQGFLGFLTLARGVTFEIFQRLEKEKF
jgi:hypothetical protein